MITTIENMQEVIRGVLKEFEIYNEEDEDLVNVMAERIFFELREPIAE